jgi:hypothetical protein
VPSKSKTTASNPLLGNSNDPIDAMAADGVDPQRGLGKPVISKN